MEDFEGKKTIKRMEKMSPILYDVEYFCKLLLSYDRVCIRTSEKNPLKFIYLRDENVKSM